MSKEMYGYLADAMVAIHVGYVAYVVVGQLLIWLGLALGWRWVRNPWFRLTHLAAIAVVVFEEIYDITCPLSEWERSLRALAEQPVNEATFLGRMLHELLFIQGQPPEFFTWVYGVTGALVLLTFALAPPRLPRLRRVQAAA